MADPLINPILDISNYFINIHAAPLFVLFLASIALGLMVLAHERFSRVSLWFFMVALTSGIWFMGFAMVYSSRKYDTALWWAHAAYLAVPFIPSAIYQFTLSVLGIYEKYKRMALANWLISAYFLISSQFSHRVLAGMYQYWWGYYVKYGWLGVPFIIWFMGIFTLSLGHFWGEHRRSIAGSTHQQRTRAFLIAFGIGSMALIVVPAKFGMALYPLGFIPYLIFIMLAGRAIWTHHLLDITPAFAADQIIDTMTDALLVLDKEGFIRLVNRAATELFGRSGRALQGMKAAEIVEDELFGQILDEVFASRRVEGYEITHYSGQNQRMVLGVSASVMVDNRGYPVAVVCMLRDITALKKIDELEEFHYVTVGREMKMKELEKEVKSLQRRLKKLGG